MNKRQKFESIYIKAVRTALFKHRRRIAAYLARDIWDYLVEPFEAFAENQNQLLAVEAGNKAVAKLLDAGDLPDYIDPQRLQRLVDREIEQILDKPIQFVQRFYRERIKTATAVVADALRSPFAGEEVKGMWGDYSHLDRVDRQIDARLRKVREQLDKD